MVGLDLNIEKNEENEENEKNEISGGEFQFLPSFLDKFSFISKQNSNENYGEDDNIDDNNKIDNIPEIAGGFPIVDNDKIIGLYPDIQHGGKIEGLCNLKHLYVPPGLVVYSYQYKIQEPNESIIETIDDNKFDKLFNNLIHKTNKPVNNTTKVNKPNQTKNNKTKSNKKIN